MTNAAVAPAPRVPAPRRRLSTPALIAGVVAATLAAALWALGVGASGLGLGEVLDALLGTIGLETPWSASAVERRILFHIRLPRIVLGLVVGASLALSGATMQALFRNPLADPGLIGVSGGAALGAVAWIVLGGALIAALGLEPPAWIGAAMLPLCAFVGGAGVTVLVYRLARSGTRVEVVTLLLAGIACNAVVGALIGLCTFLADDQQLRSLTFWGMGSLGNAGWRLLAIPTALMIGGCALLLREARALDAMLLGERDAGFLGYRVEAIKRRCILLAALVVGSAVCLTGGIGFVGLVVPHLCRLALGPGHRRLLPVAAGAGAVLLVLADAVARTVIAPAELPIGILTAALGGPVFLAMLLRQRARWSGA